jgi:gas vesicle protein
VTNGKTLPKDVVDLWPEIFGEVTLNVVPLIYVHTIEITFKNKKVWEIDFKKNLKARNWDTFEKELKEIISQYEDEISEIDFRLDTDRIKKDITQHTKKFLNNRKLK